MQFSTLLTIFTAIMATSVAALPADNTIELSTTSVGETSYYGEPATKRALENRGVTPICGECTPGKNQCHGNYGCYSYKGGPFLCQDQGAENYQCSGDHK